MISTFLGIIKK